MTDHDFQKLIGRILLAWHAIWRRRWRRRDHA